MESARKRVDVRLGRRHLRQGRDLAALHVFENQGEARVIVTAVRQISQGSAIRTGPRIKVEEALVFECCGWGECATCKLVGVVGLQPGDPTAVEFASVGAGGPFQRIAHIVDPGLGQGFGEHAKNVFAVFLGQPMREREALVVCGFALERCFGGERAHLLEAELGSLKNACAQDHVAMRIPIIVMQMLAVVLSRSLSQPRRHAQVGDGEGDDAVRIAVEHIRATHIFITQPLHITGGPAAILLRGDLDLHDVDELVGDHGPQPVVRAP